MAGFVQLEGYPPAPVVWCLPTTTPEWAAHAPDTQLGSDGPVAAPLIDAGTYIDTPSRACTPGRMCIPCKQKRHGEFTVDSNRWWNEVWREPFHACVNLPLSVLLLGYVLFYAIFITFTALLFYLIGLAETDSIIPDSSWRSCMYCSWQSLTTVGYGVVSTNGTWSSVVGATAVILSVTFDAIGVGVFYQKFSNASRKAKTILHSSRACLCHAQPARGLPRRFECRVYHISDYALVDPTCKLTLARFRSGAGGAGRVCVQFQELKVGNQTPIAFLQYPWSVVHYIDDESPLAEYLVPGAAPQCTAAMAEDRVEIIVTVLGTAASTGNQCESRASYTVATIDCGCRFADALSHGDDGTLQVDQERISATVPEDPEFLVLPECY